MLGSLEGGTCQSYHSYASRWMIYRTSLLSALETAACLPAHLLAGSKVPLWLALKRGEEEGQRVESVCGREERKKKKTGTALKYTSFSLLTVEYCHLHRLGSGEFKCHSSTTNPIPCGPGSLNSRKS